MDTFQLWKLATDVALVLSILYLCVRFMRSQGPAINTRELRDVEIVLKNLLRDADVASRSLGDTLARRQQSLEQLLAEFEGGERRMASALQSAEKLRAKLSRNSAPAPVTTAEVETVETSKPAVTPEVETAPWAEPPSFENESYIIPGRAEQKLAEQKLSPVTEELITDEVVPRRTGAAAYRSVAQRHSAPAPAERRENIYGEPIGEPEVAAAPAPQPKPRAQRKVAKQPLARGIEIERLNEAEAARERESVQEVYDAAEKLLAEGENMETVAAATRLPLDEVRKLARIARRVEQTRTAEAQPEAAAPKASQPAGKSDDPTADPRLGVFANIRRQTQVL